MGSYQARVDRAHGVQSGGSNETPNDRRRIDSLSIRAAEPVGLVVGADALDIAQHPQRHTNLGQGSQDGGQPLSKEQGDERDLEVVCEFHWSCQLICEEGNYRKSFLTVLYEIEALPNNIGRQDFEEHIGHWFALKHVPPDELGENIDLICVHL